MKSQQEHATVPFYHAARYAFSERQSGRIAAVARASVALAVFALACCGPLPVSLTIATTTSVANSGLLDAIVAGFQQDHGVIIRSHLVGSGLALRMLDKQDVDVVISHAPELEASFLTQHRTWRYRKIMFNDFVLVGPSDDPANVAGVDSIEGAMRRIAESTVRFISRGDSSGTHEREQALWRLAGARPVQERLVIAGSGMGGTLRIAHETASYTLTDRSTFMQLSQSLTLRIVFQGGPDLLNTYAVITSRNAAEETPASLFFDWISTGGGRSVIEAYRIGNAAAFSVWPVKANRDDPYATPW